VLAINLAQKLGVDHSQQNIIYRKYGDFLYQKGDYDTAMQQYLKAIDNTEPSQVIRKVREAALNSKDQSTNLLFSVP
jgi:Tfp pilus assembly protein PilF